MYKVSSALVRNQERYVLHFCGSEKGNFTLLLLGRWGKILLPPSDRNPDAEIQENAQSHCRVSPGFFGV